MSIINTDTNVRLTQELAARRTERSGQVEAATLNTATPLTPAQVSTQTSYLNGILDGTHKLQNTPLNVPDLHNIFQWPDATTRMQDATNPRPNDNSGAQQLRQQYREDAQKLQQARTQAERLAQNLGPGTHTVTDAQGQQYTITVQQGKDGNNTVTVKKPDGTTETTTYNQNDPTQTTYSQQNADGSSQTLSQHGSDIDDERTNRLGMRSSDHFSLDLSGNPVDDQRDAFGGHRIITANADGSTDTKTEAGNVDGVPVYETTHQDPDYHFQPLPEPWPRPWPDTPFPWTPGPFDGLFKAETH